MQLLKKKVRAMIAHVEINESIFEILIEAVSHECGYNRLPSLFAQAKGIYVYAFVLV
jgi:hypothetical protein